MLYKIGDVVELRSDLHAGESYGDLGWVNGMRRGCPVVITGMTITGKYKIDGGGLYCYSDEMISRLIQRLKYVPYNDHADFRTVSYADLCTSDFVDFRAFEF